ncbi:MAG: phosphate signaling complex protein PhoU [Chloroflexi bacterium]|nr:phosphate signaling complex protein PhoU [Chloroflexota bacterium]
MTRRVFERQLTQIQRDMFALASMVDRAIERSMEALLQRDLVLAREVIEEDIKLNEKRYAIEEKCLELIAMQQPLAGDLRTIVAVLHVTVDLERMGDHAEGIAKVATMIADDDELKPSADISRMADIGRQMLADSLKAFEDHDAQKARITCDVDDQVDALYERVYQELIGYVIKHPEEIEHATHLTWVAHNLERIADRVTNICERVVYLVEGKIEELNVSKY